MHYSAFCMFRKWLFVLHVFSIFGICMSASTKSDSSTIAKWPTIDGNPPKLIGHRGEKVLMPEHTFGSYEIAAIEEADYVEPDLVLTKDGKLVCHHDLSLRNTTDIEQKPEFASLIRERTVLVDPGNFTTIVTNDWFIQDFNLDQLKKLKVRQSRIGIRPQYFNDLFNIPTFEEYLQLVHRMSAKLKRKIGIIPELKSPEFHNRAYGGGHYMEDELIRTLRQYGYPVKNTDKPNCRAAVDGNETAIECGDVVIQSFESDSLKYLRNQTDRDLLLAIDADHDLYTPKGMDEVAKFAQYYCLWKENLNTGVEAVIKSYNRTWNQNLVASRGGFLRPEQFAPEAHKRNMKFSVYTIYDSREPSQRNCSVVCAKENKTEELYQYFRLGVDALFVENIGEARELRMKYDHGLKLAAALRSSGNIPTFSPWYMILILLSVLSCKATEVVY